MCISIWNVTQKNVGLAVQYAHNKMCIEQHVTMCYIYTIKCERGYIIMIRFKIDILAELKNKGYTTTRIRKEKLIPEGTLTRIRKNNGEPITTATLNIICSILKKQPGFILEYVPDTTDEIKNE